MAKVNRSLVDSVRSRLSKSPARKGDSDRKRLPNNNNLSANTSKTKAYSN